MVKEPFSFRRQFSKGMTAFLVIVVCICFYFVLLRWGTLFNGISKVFKLLSPVWFGCAFAYIDNPLMKLIERQLKSFLKKRGVKNEKYLHAVSRGIGITVSVSVALLIMVILTALVLPDLIKSLQQLVRVLPQQLNDLVNNASALQSDSKFSEIGKEMVEKAISSFQSWLSTDFSNKLNQILTQATSKFIGFIGTILNMLIGVIICVYILYSKERFSGQAKKLLYAVVKPEKGNFLLQLTFKANEIFTGFLVGKLIDSLIIGILCYIGMTLFHISDSYILLVSVIVGVTNIIPFFGPYIGAIPSALLLYLENPMHCLYFVIFILCLQQFDGNILGPKILGDKTGLSAFWVVVAILLGGGLFGIIGMIFGVPTFAVIYYIVKMSVNERLKKRNLPDNTWVYADMTGFDLSNMTVRSHSKDSMTVKESKFHINHHTNGDDDKTNAESSKK